MPAGANDVRTGRPIKTIRARGNKRGFFSPHHSTQLANRPPNDVCEDLARVREGTGVASVFTMDEAKVVAALPKI